MFSLILFGVVFNFRLIQGNLKKENVAICTFLNHSKGFRLLQDTFSKIRFTRTKNIKPNVSSVVGF